jgi:DivIVA domain-containing protein
MGQFLLLVVIALTVGAVVFGVTVLLTGGDRGLMPAEPDGRAVPLPGTRPLVESDIARVRFDVAARGYRMAQVDQAMRRAAYDIGYKDELINVLEAEVDALRSGRFSDAEVLRRAREAAQAATPSSTGAADPGIPAGEPAPEGPTAEGLAGEEPAVVAAAPEGSAAPEEAAAEQPAAERLAAVDGAPEGSAAERSAAAEQPAAEQPAAERLAAVDGAPEGSAAAEPAVEEPTAAGPDAAEQRPADAEQPAAGQAAADAPAEPSAEADPEADTGDAGGTDQPESDTVLPSRR